MGSFKKYLLSEEIGLGNLGQKMGQFFHSDYIDAKISGAFKTTHDGKSSPSFGKAMNMPTTSIDIPSIERSGRIQYIDYKRNPIYIRLSDGTEASFTYDEFRRIEGKPSINKTMKIIFQRHPNDWTKNSSKIDKAIILD